MPVRGPTQCVCVQGGTGSAAEREWFSSCTRCPGGRGSDFPHHLSCFPVFGGEKVDQERNAAEVGCSHSEGAGVHRHWLPRHFACGGPSRGLVVISTPDRVGSCARAYHPLLAVISIFLGDN